MKTVVLIFALALSCFYSGHSFAQTKTAAPELTRYTEYSYMKVKPEMREDYIKLEKAWKKIHASRKKAGKLDDWSLLEVISPNGSKSEYNFVTRNAYRGEDSYAASFNNYIPENWQSLLTFEELQLVMRTDEIRTMVKNETWVVNDVIWAADADTKAKVVVFNYFEVPKGKTNADHTKIEMDVWKPIHEARVKDGSMKGWLMLDLIMPFGSSLPYSQATIDAYTDMRQFLTPWTNEYVKKVHPGKDANMLFKQTADVCTLVKGEVRMVLDRLAW